jgi:hypothetical protein
LAREVIVNSVPLWVTLLGFVVPFIALAGSAVAFVLKVYRDGADRRWNQFFELMKFIDSKDLPIATKCAAAYQLRHFPEHKEFIIRFCQNQRLNIEGSAAAALIMELDGTREALSKISN